MVLEKDILPLWQWLPLSLLTFLFIVLVVAALGAFIGFLFAAVRGGPAAALQSTIRTIAIGIRELFEMSPRRVLAMSRLAFQEAIRRKVLVVFAVFLACMLFAGWFLDRSADHPARLYLSFVLTATNYLIIILAIFLGSFSLPNDMKTRTIYTVVTKPVRAWEIVLGRMIGFAVIGTTLLVFMGLFSYLFVVRGLRHEHTVNVAELTDSSVERRGELVTVKQGESSRQFGHRHEVVVDSQGRSRVESIQDHTHPPQKPDAQGNIRLGRPEGQLQARIPIYGKLTFLGRDGKPVAKGVNVGNEWSYRSFIEGKTLATAIWTFEGVDQYQFPEGLPLEMMIRVFRTYKGEIERGILGSIQVVEADQSPPGSPPTPIEQRNRFETINFTAREFTADRRDIPRKYRGIEPDGTVRDMDLFDDLVRDGKVEIRIQCLEAAQYYGMAKADLYIRAADGYFWLNFVKGFVGLWYQMVIVTCFAVMFSTFLNGAVAMLTTVVAIILGYVANFVRGIQTGEVEGGGPAESACPAVLANESNDRVGTGRGNFDHEGLRLRADAGDAGGRQRLAQLRGLQYFQLRRVRI